MRVTRRGDVVHAPMSSDTQVGSALALLLSSSGVLDSYGGIDCRVMIFLHNFLMGFMHDGRYRGLGGNNLFVMDLLSVFGISFRVGVDGNRALGQFRLGSVRSWIVGGKDGVGLLGGEGVEEIASFLSALDGSRPLVVDNEARFKDSMMASAWEIIKILQGFVVLMRVCLRRL